MKSTKIFALGAITLLGLASTPAQSEAGWSVGVRFGGPIYCGPYYRPWYYRPYGAVIVQPAPIVVQPVPVVQPAPVVQPTYTAGTAEQMPAPVEQGGQVGLYLAALADPSEQIRLDAVTHLGRLKAQRTIDPLAATLAGDSSAVVREAAARALGIIGSPRGLPALKKAALTDTDRDVRHSAQFAIDIVQSR